MNLANEILHKNFSGVRRCLLSGVDVNAMDEYGFTPLIEAAIIDHIEIAEMLISAGADVNGQDSTGATALHWAAENNNVHLVKLLLDYRADPNKLTFSSKPVLLMPYLRRQQGLKTLLYQHGADLRFCQDYINAKSLGHRFELVGSIDLITRQGEFSEINFEGFFLEFTLATLENSLQEFTQHFASRELRFYYDKLQVIVAALKRASRLITYQQYQVDIEHYRSEIENLLSAEWVILPVAVEGHALTFIKHGNLLTRCDRQANSGFDDTIELYRMARPMNSLFMQHCLYQKNTTEFMREEMQSRLGLVKIGEIGLPAQKSGNCSWANVEAVVPAMLWQLLDEDNPTESLLNKNKAFLLFEKWQQWDRDRELSFCLASMRGADNKRRIIKAELLAAILFNTFSGESEEDVRRAKRILEILLSPRYAYLIKDYVRAYCFDAKTEEGERFKALLNACGYTF